MLLAKLLSKIYKKEGGIVLTDYSGQKYIIGQPRRDNPITLKLLKKNLNWKLVVNPDLSFPEAYMNDEIIIENATLSEFLDLAFKNVGRGEITTSAYIIKKILQLWRFISNYNFPLKSKKDVQSHYDVGGSKGEKLYEIFLDRTHILYSCSYWKKDKKTLEEAQNNSKKEK